MQRRPNCGIQIVSKIQSVIDTNGHGQTQYDADFSGGSSMRCRCGFTVLIRVRRHDDQTHVAGATKIVHPNPVPLLRNVAV
jgi:DNA-directed RNA polymerase subunit RPC12/RpoP